MSSDPNPPPVKDPEPSKKPDWLWPLIGVLILVGLIVLCIPLIKGCTKAVKSAVKSATNEVSSPALIPPVTTKKVLTEEQKQNRAMRRELAVLKKQLAELRTATNVVTFKAGESNLVIRTSGLGGIGTYAGNVSGSNNCNIYIYPPAPEPKPKRYVEGWIWVPDNPKRPCPPDRPPPGPGPVIVPPPCAPPPSVQPQSYFQPGPAYVAPAEYVRPPEPPSYYYVNPGLSTLGRGCGPGYRVY